MASRCCTTCPSGLVRTRTFATTCRIPLPSTEPSSFHSSQLNPRLKRNLHPIRLSMHFSPTQKASQSSATDDSLPSLQLLLRGGYIRSSSSGIFTLLPSSLRLLSKVQAIIDSELSSISCTRVSLPTLLPSTLYHRTGRYQLIGSELYKLTDRKQSEFVLGPTHEEEITKLAACEIESDRQLPLRLYQITRKFRDEPRPRMGLLRTKEFLMKDLYSFDKSEKDALVTYEQVREAYGRIFDRIFGNKGGWKAAEADTGAIGGSTSHEYHVQDAAGEDTLISCSNEKCGYSANEEKAVSLPDTEWMPVDAGDVRVLLYGCTDVKVQDQVLHAFVLPKARGLSDTKLQKLLGKLKTHTQQLEPQQSKRTSKVKKGQVKQQDKIELLYDSVFPDSQVSWDWKDRPEGPLVRFTSLSVLSDFECASIDPAELNAALTTSVNAFTSRPSSSSSTTTDNSAHLSLIDLFPTQFGQYSSTPTQITPPLTLVDIRNATTNDTCPSCRTPNSLRQTKAIEVGHTFYLGDRYSRALEAGFLPSLEVKKEIQGVEKLANGRIPFQMGCYGIGVSRILGALAQKAAAQFDQRFNTGLVDEKKKRGGFIWPSEVAPYTGVVVVADAKDQLKLRAAEQVWERVLENARGRDGTVRDVLQSIVAQHADQGSVQGVQVQDSGDGGKGWSTEQASELVIDDRTCTLGSKLADSDLTGYSYRIIIGKHYNTVQGKVELQYISPFSQGRGGERWKSLILPLSAFST